MREEGGVAAPFVENVVFGWHCHGHPENSKKANREMTEDESKIIDRGEDVEDEIANRHEAWKQKAKSESKKLYDELSERDDTVDYACQRPHLSGGQVEQNTGEKMTRFAIDMARMRRIKKEDQAVYLSDLTKPG